MPDRQTKVCAVIVFVSNCWWKDGWKCTMWIL